MSAKLNVFLICFILAAIPAWLEGQEAKEEVVRLQAALANCYPEQNENNYIIMHRKQTDHSIECGKSKKLYRQIERRKL